MIGTEEIVVKPLGEHFISLKMFSGATIMGDGETVLILDISGIADYSKLSSIELLENKSQAKSAIINKDAGYILFESSNQRFAISSSSVTCIEKINILKIEKIFSENVIQYKEDIIPLLRLEDFYNIPKKDFAKDAYCIIVSINNKTIGILIHEIIDVIDSIHILTSNKISGQGVLGQAIIQNHSTIVLDIFALLTPQLALP